eukprot:augustus_masked-scaffold_95-processed-gene-0.35-mRNA-1 protein AED:1.00 eAED:1.00 QI:0/0/0/0/1/1/2/0/173
MQDLIDQGALGEVLRQQRERTRLDRLSKQLAEQEVAKMELHNSILKQKEVNDELQDVLRRRKKKKSTRGKNTLGREKLIKLNVYPIFLKLMTICLTTIADELQWPSRFLSPEEQIYLYFDKVNKISMFLAEGEKDQDRKRIVKILLKKAPICINLELDELMLGVKHLNLPIIK